jgi:hypothetical protein
VRVTRRTHTQGEDTADVLDDSRDIKDHILGLSLLLGGPVDFEGEADFGWIGDF